MTATRTTLAEFEAAIDAGAGSFSAAELPLVIEALRTATLPVSKLGRYVLSTARRSADNAAERARVAALVNKTDETVRAAWIAARNVVAEIDELTAARFRSSDAFSE